MKVVDGLRRLDDLAAEWTAHRIPWRPVAVATRAEPTSAPVARRRLFTRPLYKDWCIWLAAFAIVCALVSWVQPGRPVTFLNLLWIPPIQLAVWGAVPARIRRWLRTRNLASDVPQRIEGLGRLREQGLITEQEFENKKVELLGRM